MSILLPTVTAPVAPLAAPVLAALASAVLSLAVLTLDTVSLDAEVSVDADVDAVSVVVTEAALFWVVVDEVVVSF
ncbi:hypothetical protein [Deinococcus sp. Marseille-Q6407]|uniref:hypothetical protein n=1 Tax=Deinococcus sp. Marseille-Q6407 TaxID=2969223 RepID=UPI0021BF0417|nr:hypothetical protein [Deinococcus sp. Marseille-Q6407]